MSEILILRRTCGKWNWKNLYILQNFQKYCNIVMKQLLFDPMWNVLFYLNFKIYFIGFFHIVHYNIENWVWNLAGLELSPLCAACCRLVSSLENMLASSCDYPQLNCHSADMEFQQPVLWGCYTSNHPTVLASQ